MNRKINHVTVIGSGVMGSAIACHFANIGVAVLLLDIVPKELLEAEKKKGLSLKDKAVRNRIVNTALQKAIKSKPAPLYTKKFASRITTGNLEDDLTKIKDSDWVIEVVTERLDIKKSVFEQVDQHRKKGTLVSSNTSGIPLHYMSKGRSSDFQKHFCGTHFFNPPRYLELLEIIPGPQTDTEVLTFLEAYGSKFLGKKTVLAKDTPAFIGNRIGTFGIMSLFHQVKELDLTIEEIDQLTGTLIGRPKSATFRTADVVGLDTLVHVANGLYENCPTDEQRDQFKVPDFVQQLIADNRLGAKTEDRGFYQKVPQEKGPSQIKALDLNTLQYRDMKKVDFKVIKKAKAEAFIEDRYPILLADSGKAGAFYKQNFAALFSYSSLRIPEITDELYKIDDAMKAGYGWTHGPFEIWNAIGVQRGIDLIQAQQLEVAPWVLEMVEKGKTAFYTVKEGKTYYYDLHQKKEVKIPGQDSFIILDNIRQTKAVFSNDELMVQDLDDGILNVEFRSKMNTMGKGVLDGLNKAIDLAEKQYQGLVVYNEGSNFSAGANIGLILQMASEQDFDALNKAVEYFQQTSMRMRYSAIPTISAPHAMTLGGGCEISLHADKIVAAAETYIGLVEVGVGLIPGGGGTKEMTLRAADSIVKGDVELNRYQQNLITIGMAKVSQSAQEAFELGIMQPFKDIVVVSKERQLALAKQEALLLAENGYTKPLPRTDIKVLGKQGLGAFLVGTDQMVAGRYISPYDQKVVNKLAYVMAGGDLSEKSEVSEQYLLDLEREAFLSLCGERKTLERLQHMLKTGKPLRN